VISHISDAHPDLSRARDRPEDVVIDEDRQVFTVVADGRNPVPDSGRPVTTVAETGARPPGLNSRQMVDW